MSSFSTFRGKNMRVGSMPIPIKNKAIPQSELKKQKKLEQTNKSANSKNTVSDSEFESLMDENKVSDTNTCINVNTFTYPDPNIIDDVSNKLIENKLLGFELVNFVNKQNLTISGIAFLNTLLQKISQEPLSIDWIGPTQYGMLLSELLKDKINDQVTCLIMIQNYCAVLDFPKIQMKTNLQYLVKIIFQLMFTNEIIDESAYYKWQEYLETLEKTNPKLSQTLLIQTTDFFMLLKTVFEENNDDIDEDEFAKKSAEFDNEEEEEEDGNEYYEENNDDNTDDYDLDNL